MPAASTASQTSIEALRPAAARAIKAMRSNLERYALRPDADARIVAERDSHLASLVEYLNALEAAVATGSDAGDLVTQVATVMRGNPRPYAAGRRTAIEGGGFLVQKLFHDAFLIANAAGIESPLYPASAPLLDLSLIQAERMLNR